MVDHDKEVGHVLENVIHEMLEGCQGISKAHWHDEEFEGSVVGSKCGLPFMAQGDADIIVPCGQT